MSSSWLACSAVSGSEAGSRSSRVSPTIDGHRRPQLVADVGQEPGLRLAGLPQLVATLVQLGVEGDHPAVGLLQLVGELGVERHHALVRLLQLGVEPKQLVALGLDLLQGRQQLAGCARPAPPAVSPRSPPPPRPGWSQAPRPTAARRAPAAAVPWRRSCCSPCGAPPTSPSASPSPGCRRQSHRRPARSPWPAPTAWRVGPGPARSAGSPPRPGPARPASAAPPRRARSRCGPGPAPRSRGRRRAGGPGGEPRTRPLRSGSWRGAARCRS